MVVTHEFTMTLDRRGVTPVVDAVQGDANTRAVKVTLTVGGVPFTPPAGAVASVAFRKPDGKKGWYDKLPDGSAACTTEGNTVTAILAPEVLTVAGQVEAVIILQDADLDQLATFEFTVQVAKNLAAGITVSNDYYSYSTMEQVSAALDGFFAQAEKEQTAFEEKIGKEQAAFLKTASNALDAVHTAAGENGPAIVCEETGSVITANDASNRLLQGLTLYGKTTQDGTPTPENPVELVSAGYGGAINTTVCGGNLFDMGAAWPNCRIRTDTGVAEGLTGMYSSDYTPVAPETAYVLNFSYYSTGNYGMAFYNKDKVYISGAKQSNTYAGGGDPFVFTTPANCAYIRFSITSDYIDIAQVILNAGTAVIPYEPYTAQFLTAHTPNGLPGIPVASGGNYTDENGQAWICDEIDFARGVYVKRTMLLDTFSGSDNGNSLTLFMTSSDYALVSGAANIGICTATNKYEYSTNSNVHFYVTNSGARVFLPSDFDNTGNVLKVLAALVNSIETPLSAEELAQYSALHTNKPNIFAYNDAGAGMKLAYVADTKLYIDKKFNELAAAIVNNA